MRVVFLTLLAIGALHGLPLEQSSGLESSVSDASSVVLEGSGNVANKVDTASEDVVIDAALNKIPPRSKRDDASATTTTEAATTLADGRLEMMDFGDEEEGEGELRQATKKLKKAQKKLTNETDDGSDWFFEISAADIGNDTVKSAVRALDEAVEEGSTVLEDNNATTTTESSNTTCEALRSCHDDSDCNGGQCLGAFLGTCNCNSCMSFWKCTADSDCGGFKQACNTTTGMCDCFGAYVLNGFKDTMDALSNLCNVKACGRDTAADDCFGLPCNTGHCFC